MYDFCLIFWKPPEEIMHYDADIFRQPVEYYPYFNSDGESPAGE